MELISIIIPVYNCEKYLRRNLESISNQSYQNLEIIYVDDGSSDKSADIIQSFMEKDQRIKLIQQTNHGVSYARNAGLKAATGTLITFSDADDYVDERYVETMASAIQEEQADAACTGFVLHRPDMDVTMHGNGEKLVWSTDEALKQLLSGEYLDPGVVAKMFRRETVEGVCFQTNVKYNEDYLWLLEAFGRCKKVAFRAEATYHYVLHANSATTSISSLSRSRDTIYVSETAAKLPFSEEITSLLERKRLVGYLDNYNSLLYGKGREIKEQKKLVRKKILDGKKTYGQLGMTKREQFFYYGIKLCPGIYRWVYRGMKRILPDRRTFRI